MQNPLTKLALIIIYEAFVRSHLDYDDIIYVKLTMHLSTINLNCFNAVLA